MTAAAELALGLVEQGFSHAIKQGLTLLAHQRQQLGFDQLLQGPAAQVGVHPRLSQGAVHQLSNKQALHLMAAQKAFNGVEGPIDQGAFRFGRVIGEPEFPVEMTPLPPLTLEVRRDALAEAVERNLIDALGKALAPTDAMAPEAALQNVARDGMATVVAVTDAVRTFNGGERHGAQSMHEPTA